MRSFRRRSAFTLIELLIVVAIIAVLIALLLPTLARAKEQARTVKCLANLRSIGIGFGQYRSEWDDMLPPVDAYGAHVGGPGTWDTDPWRFSKDYGMQQAIGPYTGNSADYPVGPKNWGRIGSDPTKPLGFVTGWQKGWQKNTIWMCPDPNDLWSGPGQTPPHYDYPSNNGYSESVYLIEPANTSATAPWGNSADTSAWSRPFARVQQSAMAIHVADAATVGKPTHVKTLGTAASVRNQTNIGFDLYRHNMNQGGNILFADGHAKYYRREDVWANITYLSTSPNSQQNFRLP